MVQPLVRALGKKASTTVCPRKSPNFTGSFSKPYRVAPGRTKSGAIWPTVGANAADPGLASWAAAYDAAHAAIATASWTVLRVNECAMYGPLFWGGGKMS